MTVHVKQLLVKGTLQRAPDETGPTAEQQISAGDLEAWRDDIMEEVRKLIDKQLRDRSER